MSDIKELVPPLDLCKLIPAGEFAESAFVWVVNGDYQPKFQIVDKRKYPFIPEDGATLYPAPTLEEILDTLPATVKVDYRCFLFHIYNDVPNGYEITQNSGSTAAIKLWLKLKGIEYGQKQS